MVAAAALSWLGAAAVPGLDSDVDILLGMIAPLGAAVATWVLVTRTYASRPERLTPLMVVAFGCKVVFFGVYVTVMLRVLEVEPLPFVVSFTAYFIGFHVFEALCLQRLFAGNTPAAH
jgi:hypothetical protein